MSASNCSRAGRVVGDRARRCACLGRRPTRLPARTVAGDRRPAAPPTRHRRRSRRAGRWRAVRRSRGSSRRRGAPRVREPDHVRRRAGAVEPEEPDGVVVDDRRRLVIGDVGELLVDDRAGVRPVALHVREVGRPLDAVDADVVADLHPEPVDLEAPVEVVVDVPAGCVRPLVGAAPVAVPPPVLVGVLLELRDPSDLGLGEEELELREAVERAVLDELDDEPPTGRGLRQHRGHRREVDLQHALRRCIARAGSSAAGATAEAHVGGERDVELDGRVPRTGRRRSGSGTAEPFGHWWSTTPRMPGIVATRSSSAIGRRCRWHGRMARPSRRSGSSAVYSCDSQSL